MTERLERRPLGSLVKITGGGTPSKGRPEYYQGDVPWVTPKDMKSWDITDAQDHITEEAIAHSATKLIEPGSVLLVIRSGILKHTLPVGINRVPVAINQDMKALRCGPGLDPDYLARALQWSAPRILGTARATTADNIALDVVRRLEVPVPPLAEQRRIAAILDKADAIRRKRQQALTFADDLHWSAFLEMFGDPVTNPMAWPTVRLGMLCRIRRGASPRPINEYLGGTVPWIKIGDISVDDPIYITDTAEHVTEAGASKSVLLEPGALIFSNSGSLGLARILRIKGCIHDGWLSLDDLSPLLDKVFLLALLNLSTGHFLKIAPQGTQKNLNTGIMRSFATILPPRPLQERFDLLASNARSLRMHVLEARAAQETLFGSLVQRAFRGDLTSAVAAQATGTHQGAGHA
ncbi:MAG: restriction endonuclease subunit S [Acidobacteriia bacterium]|nr:restriction endonuclease subunit S [Terriglobia bacterium]